MVRVKYRVRAFPPPPSPPSAHPPQYLVLEAWLEDATARPPQPAELLRAVRSSLAENFGVAGAGRGGRALRVVSATVSAGTYIVRCGAGREQETQAATALITRLGSRVVALDCVHVSGTILKAKRGLQHHLQACGLWDGAQELENELLAAAEERL